MNTINFQFMFFKMFCSSLCVLYTCIHHLFQLDFSFYFFENWYLNVKFPFRTNSHFDLLERRERLHWVMESIKNMFRHVCVSCDALIIKLKIFLSWIIEMSWCIIYAALQHDLFTRNHQSHFIRDGKIVEFFLKWTSIKDKNVLQMWT